MQSSDILLGLLATVVGGIGYFRYLRDIFRGKTKPHAFSWFVWGLLTSIAFAAQIVSHAGPGAWVTGLTAIVCLGISVLGLLKGNYQFDALDWWSLSGALLGIAVWKLTNEPLLAVIFVTITDTIGFVPTFRKGYRLPYEETLSHYILASLKFLISLPALSALTLVNWLYPVSLILGNGVFAIMLIVRRKQLSVTNRH